MSIMNKHSIKRKLMDEMHKIDARLNIKGMDKININAYY